MIQVKVLGQNQVRVNSSPQEKVKIGSESSVVFSGGSLGNVAIGNGLILEETKDGEVLRVNSSSSISDNNTLPITSAAVYTEIGNINALLETI